MPNGGNDRVVLRTVLAAKHTAMDLAIRGRVVKGSQPKCVVMEVVKANGICICPVEIVIASGSIGGRKPDGTILRILLGTIRVRIAGIDPSICTHTEETAGRKAIED